MDERDRFKLRKNRLKIMNDLEPKGEVLDVLKEKSILTDNECEKIGNGITQKERCEILLDILPRRGPSAFNIFLMSLANCFPHIRDLLNRESGCHKPPENGKPCTRCREFFPEHLTSHVVRILLYHYGCFLYHNIDPLDIIDFLYQEGILFEDEFEKVKSGCTRPERCKYLFRALDNSKSGNVLNIFLKSLEKKYGYIAEGLRQASSDHCANNNDYCSETVKRKCFDSDINNSFTAVKSCDDILCSGVNGVVSGNPTNHIMTEIGNDNESSLCLRSNTLGSSIFSLQSDNTNMVTDNCLDNGLPETKESRNYPNLSFPETFSMSILSTHVKNFGSEDETHRKLYRKNHKKSKGYCFQSCCVEVGNGPVCQMNPGSIPYYQFPSRRLTMMFEHLVQLIYQGNYIEFETKASEFMTRYHDNPDMVCTLSFLQASRCLFETDLSKVKRCIKKVFETIPKTSNPMYFELELMSALLRLYMSEKTFGKVEALLADAKMMVKLNSVHCSGRSVGWLYMFDSRYKTICMSAVHPDRPNSIQQYKIYLEEASKSNQIAMDHFQQDRGIDSQIGFNYTVIRSAMLLLQCGDNGCTMDVLQPPEDNISRAKDYLDWLENSNNRIPKFLKVHFLLAKCDYFYRCNNSIRALENAEDAYTIALDMKLQSYAEHAYNRLCHLKKHSAYIGGDKLRVCDYFSSDTEE